MEVGERQSAWRAIWHVRHEELGYCLYTATTENSRNNDWCLIYEGEYKTVTQAFNQGFDWISNIELLSLAVSTKYHVVIVGWKI